MATLEDFRAWYDRDLGRWANWDKCVQVRPHDPGEIRIAIFTDKNIFAITAIESRMRKAKTPGGPGIFQKLTVTEMEGILRGADKFVEIEPDGSAYIYPASLQPDGGYLGCTSSTRKMRAGEDHHRGSDLKDGKFTEETWHAILADIVAYELVEVVKERRDLRCVPGQRGVPDFTPSTGQGIEAGPEIANNLAPAGDGLTALSP